jgi:Lrp/AsnC family leucine-responsive transcriptional regulator
MDIDKIDRKILSILQGDGRIASVELAERIPLPVA